MRKYNGFLLPIVDELNIRKGQRESEIEWKSRIIYSVIGQMALASLYDEREDSEPVSVTHFKRRVEELYDAYMSMYPEICPLYGCTAAELADEIFDICVKAGLIYHSPYRVTASKKRTAQLGNIVFSRGLPLCEKVFRSGLGAYVYSEEEKNESLTSMFGLLEDSLSDYWSVLTKNISWSEFVPPQDTEYLVLDPPFTNGYFKNKPDKDGRISLLRFGIGEFIYYLYRYKDGKIYGMQLPLWRVSENRYRLVSNACINSYKNLPPIVFHTDVHSIHIRVQYLLPPAEQNLIRLYSWPDGKDNSFNPFSYIMTDLVFFVIKKELESKGYHFIEE